MGNYKNNSRGQRSNNGSNNRNSNNDSNNGEQKKHSGCKMSLATKGSHQGSQVLTGWKYSKRTGMISIIASPYSKTQEVISKSNRTWQNWMVKFTFKDTLQTKIYGGLFDVNNHKIIIKEIGWVLNPKAPNGGYVGKF